MRGFITLLLLLLALMLPARAVAQDRAIHWERYDVEVEVLENGDLRFTETQVLVVDRGTFRTGSRSFNTGEFGRVRSVEVLENGEPYRRGTDAPGTFVAEDDGQRFELNYVFRDPGVSQHTMTIRYTVGRALAEQSGQALLEWNFFCATSGCPPIEAGAISIRLPGAASQDDVEATASGAPVRQTGSGADLRWELTEPIQAQQVSLSVAFPRSMLAPNATFRSGSTVPSDGRPLPEDSGEPQGEPPPVNVAPGVGTISPFWCFVIIIVLFLAFSIMRSSMRQRGYTPPPPRRRRAFPYGGMGVPQGRRRRSWGGRGYGGWGIPPIIVAPPFGRRDDSGGSFAPPEDVSPGGGGSAWGGSGGGGMSWGDSGGGGSSWGSSGGGGSSWGGGGGSSSGGSGGSGGGSGDSSSFG